MKKQGENSPKQLHKKGDEPQNTQTQKQQEAKSRSLLLRCIALVTMFVVAAGALGLRLSQLQIEQASEWEARAARQQLASIEIEPLRGNIYDANMNLMAQSATVWTVESSPDVLSQSRIPQESAEKDPARIAARELAAILELDEQELYEELSDEESMYHLVKSKIEKPVADMIRTMMDTYNLSGIYLTEDTKRYYPYESLASTILGFVGNDNNGLEGIERQYEETLAGVPGRTIIARDAYGQEIPTEGDGTTYPVQDGSSIVLTVNMDIQRSLDENLQAAVEMYQPEQRGMAIAMDVNTGAILGLSVYPSYDPNSPYEIMDTASLDAMELLAEGSDEWIQMQGEARTLQWRNKALADTYEPGSIMKIVTAAAALDSGLYTQNNTFACGGSIMVEGWDSPIRCAGETAHGMPDLRNALIESCNVSFVQMSAGMGADVWYSYLNAFGLTEPTGIDLPGEPSQAAVDNLVYSLDELGAVELASCSFGQSNKYTMVQMITAVSAAVNGGNLMQPYIVQQELDSAGNVVAEYEPVVKRQVISTQTSEEICDILEELVSSTPNGQNAYIPGYNVGGKSGTSEKLDVVKESEDEEIYISSFVGFAPADDPQIAVILALDEPIDPTGLGTYFGGRLAGPFVREVIADAMDVLGVEPQYSTDAELARTTVSCPDVTENDIVSAQTIVNKAGLTARVVGEGDTVIGQYPQAYTQIPYAGEVIMYTDASAPQELVTVPNLVDRTPENAIELLKSLGLNVLTEGAPDSGDGVVVIAQSILPDEEVPLGSVVVLTMENITDVQE